MNKVTSVQQNPVVPTDSPKTLPQFHYRNVVSEEESSRFVSNDESVGKLVPFLLLPLCFLPFTRTRISSGAIGLQNMSNDLLTQTRKGVILPRHNMSPPPTTVVVFQTARS